MDSSPEESICQEAERVVNGPRRRDYDHPLDNFRRTALIWEGLIGHKMKDGEHLSEDDVGAMMIGLKLARQIHSPKRDNLVDTAGYALCIQMCHEEDERRRAEKAAMP